MESVSLESIHDTGKLFEDFCGDCKLRDMSGESIRRYKSSLSIFSKYLLNRSTNIFDVNMHMLKDFLQYILYERNAKHKTAENYFSAISAFFEYLVFEGLVSNNMVLPFRKRYLRQYKEGYEKAERMLLNLEDMSNFVCSIMDPRDSARARLTYILQCIFLERNLSCLISKDSWASPRMNLIIHSSFRETLSHSSSKTRYQISFCRFLLKKKRQVQEVARARRRQSVPDSQ